VGTTIITSHLLEHKMCCLQTLWKINLTVTLTVFLPKKIMYMDNVQAYKYEMNKMILK